jgi:hypothetical protein
LKIPARTKGLHIQVHHVPRANAPRAAGGFNALAHRGFAAIRAEAGRVPEGGVRVLVECYVVSPWWCCGGRVLRMVSMRWRAWRIASFAAGRKDQKRWKLCVSAG